MERLTRTGFPQVAQNFIIRLRSENNTALDVDRKMNKWKIGRSRSKLMMMVILLLSIDLFAN